MRGCWTWVPNPIEQRIWRLCAKRLNKFPKDIVRYIASFIGDIVGPFHHTLCLKFTEVQKRLYQSSVGHNLLVWDTPRKCGSTTTLAAIIATEMIMSPIPLSIYYRTSLDKSVREFVYMLSQFVPFRMCMVEDYQTFIRICYDGNNSIVYVTTADPFPPIRATHIIFDHCENLGSKYFFYHVVPRIEIMMNTPPIIILNGSCRGKSEKNWFWELFNRGDANFYRIRLNNSLQ